MKNKKENRQFTKEFKTLAKGIFFQLLFNYKISLMNSIIVKCDLSENNFEIKMIYS